MDTHFWEEHKPIFLKPDPSQTTSIIGAAPPMKPYIEGDPYPAVPAELKSLRQWVLWKKELRDGKPTKVPYQVNGRKAQSNNPTTWTDYRTVVVHQHRFDGIGFVFTPDDPFCGIDLDNCIDQHRKLKSWAVPIVERLKKVSYGEVSPSKTGIKFWTRAKLPDWINTGTNVNISDGKIETYHKARYFTATGAGKGEIHHGQAEVDWLVTEYLKSPKTQPQVQRKPAPQSNLKSTDEVIQHIQKSKQSHKFNALMRGDITGYGSHSEADIALCSVIAFWTQDTHGIDAIFRQSKLYRDKWDEKHRTDGATYGEMTIEKALSGNRETYTQRRRPQRYRSRVRQKRLGEY